MPVIRSVATALPPYALSQERIRDLAREHFARAFADIDRYISVFRHAQIDTRHFAAPLEWFMTPRSFKECNDLFVETATTIGEAAARGCLDLAGLQPSDVDHLIWVSTTGLAAPSPDAMLINRLGMGPHTRRTPIWGLGCAGGVAGLARATEYVRAFPERRALLLSVELCSVTFQWDDRSKRNLIAASLFADGAAAVLVEGDQAENRERAPAGSTENRRTTNDQPWPEPGRRRPTTNEEPQNKEQRIKNKEQTTTDHRPRTTDHGPQTTDHRQRTTDPGLSRDEGNGQRTTLNSPRILGTQSTLWPGTLDIMGWEIVNSGMQVVFSSRIPGIVQALLRENVSEFLAAHGLEIDAIDHWVLHPGGAKVVSAYESALGIDPERLDHTRTVLRRYGNMSSSTVFFVLDAFLKAGTPAPGEYGLLAVLGPGFSCELVLIQG